MIVRLLSLLTLLGICSPAFAQIAPSLGSCGTQGRSAWLDKYQAGKIDPIRKSLETQYVPMLVTIVGDNDGNQYANPVSVLKAFQVLNSDFATIGVQFYLADSVAYINSTLYYNHSFDDGRDMIQSFSRAGVINVFIVGSPAGNCGYYIGGSYDAVALSSDCIKSGDRTWSHELGHFFGLPHTFYGWESVGSISEVLSDNQPAPDKLLYRGDSIQVERVDGSNCAEAADGFCDTDPDYLPQRWRCNGAGVYGDTLVDPDSTVFVVPGQNIMSYSDDACVEEFSQEQITAMTTNLGGRLDLADDETPTFTAARGEDQRLLSPVDEARLDFSDTVKLVWNQVENADMYVLQIFNTPNFNGSVYASFLVRDTSKVIRDILQPRQFYYWRVRPVNRYDVESTFSEARRFRNGLLSGTIDQALDAAITIAPNPLGAGRELRIEGREINGRNLSYQLTDASGRAIGSRVSATISGGEFTYYIPTRDLSPGLYFLRLMVDGRMATRKIVVTP